MISDEPSAKTPSPVAWVTAELRLLDTLDQRVVGLLTAIDETGSINQAIKRVGLSYKGAWQIIERANSICSKMLVSTVTGGTKGGSSSLTPTGKALLTLYQTLDAEHQTFIQSLNRSINQNPELTYLLKPLDLKISVPNQLAGKIQDIQYEGALMLVTVRLQQGQQIQIYHAVNELEEQGFRIEQEVLVLIKPEDLLLNESTGLDFGSGNLLQATFLSFIQDSAETLIKVLLPGDEVLLAMLTTPLNQQKYNLQPNQPVELVFSADCPLLAVNQNR